jgi:superfamily II DNA or RNA helicase
MLLSIDQINSFEAVRDWPASSLSDAVRTAVAALDERSELEPFLRDALFDPNATPHGPAEIVDILTHRVRINSKPVLAAFILKGRGFPTVRPAHVSHQIYRLEKIADLGLAVFAAVGTILDAAKEQFVSTASRLGVDYCVMDSVDLGRILVAYGFLCPRDGLRIAGGRCSCGYIPRARLTNILQDDALAGLTSSHNLGQAAGLVILPTGSGKTRIAARDAQAFGAQRILYLAHTNEILDVAAEEFGAVFGSTSVNRVHGGGKLDRPSTVNLCTVQLATRHIAEISQWACDYVVIDEFHHAAASSYRRLIESLDPQFMLGLTATPFREDRLDILSLCRGNVVVQHELRTGIETGVLCPYHYFGCFDDVDYTQLTRNGQRYTIRDLERVLVVPARDAAIVSKWRERADGFPTLAFCCSHTHASRVADAFRASGVTAESYISTTAPKNRRELLDRLRAGDLKVLTTVDVLNEGVDIPYVECLLFLRPTESKRIFFQQLGRGLRRSPGKSHCTVVDFIGNFKNAYRIVEYQGLVPSEAENLPEFRATLRDPREILNLPLGCQVHFEDRVVDLFTQQLLDPRNATRQNIGRILLYQLARLESQLGRKPTRTDIKRHCLLGTDLYDLVFRGIPDLESW